MKKNIKKALKNSKGNALIEFALLVPIVFVLLVGLINFGWLAMTLVQLNSVIDAGVSYVISNPNATPSQIQTQMTNATTLSPLTVTVTSFCQCSTGGNINCSTTCADGTTPGAYVQMQAQSSLSLPLHYILQNPFPLNQQATIRVQ